MIGLFSPPAAMRLPSCASAPVTLPNTVGKYDDSHLARRPRRPACAAYCPARTCGWFCSALRFGVAQRERLAGLRRRRRRAASRTATREHGRRTTLAAIAPAS